MADTTNQAQRRMSQLQQRNKQVKPHLQSSYALEDVSASVDEELIRGERYSKENRVYIFLIYSFLRKFYAFYRMIYFKLSNINAKTIKRPNEEQLDAGSQKKTR